MRYSNSVVGLTKEISQKCILLTPQIQSFIFMLHFFSDEAGILDRKWRAATPSW